MWWTGQMLAETSLLDAYYVTYDLKEKRILKEGRGMLFSPWSEKWADGKLLPPKMDFGL